MAAKRMLSIVGLGRSGSTLLARLLGQIDGVVPVGEISYIWDRGVLDNEQCGCGKAFYDCPFWVSIGEAAYGGWDEQHAREVLDKQQHVQRRRYTPMLAQPSRFPKFERRMLDYLELVRPLYAALTNHPGVDLVTDSSKFVSYTTLLDQIPELDVIRLHLVRDSRGVAFSWSQSVVRPETKDLELMPQFSPTRTAGEWVVDNLLLEALSRRDPRNFHLRYEDLVDSPQATINSIAERLELKDPPSFDAGEVTLRATHSIGGNPMRFRTGAISVAPDERWRRQMPRRDRNVVTAITYPLLRRYRYDV